MKNLLTKQEFALLATVLLAILVIVPLVMIAIKTNDISILEQLALILVGAIIGVIGNEMLHTNQGDDTNG